MRSGEAGTACPSSAPGHRRRPNQAIKTRVDAHLRNMTRQQWVDLRAGLGKAQALLGGEPVGAKDLLTQISNAVDHQLQEHAQLLLNQACASVRSALPEPDKPDTDFLDKAYKGIQK